MALSYRKPSRSSQDTQKNSTLLQLSHETQTIPRYSAATMVQKDQAEPMNLSTDHALTSSSIVPQKRKSSLQLKFYAVKVGHNPGVYLSWKECERNISGFKGAVCEYSYNGQMTSTKVALSQNSQIIPHS